MRTYDMFDSSKEGEQAILDAAKNILERRLQRHGKVSEPASAERYLTSYLTAHAAHLEHEIFGCIFLDNQHSILAIDGNMFRGTTTGASVYPREIAKACLTNNAVAIIIFHNHPSFSSTFSQSDIHITREIRAALQLIEVRVLDHLLVAGTEIVSMASKGLI